MSEIKLKRMVKICDPDLFKRGHNELWDAVESLVNKHFGSLNHSDRDELFIDNYVVDFEDHSDEIGVLPHIKGILSEKHSKCVQEIVNWVKKTPSVEGKHVRRYVDDIPQKSIILTDDRRKGRLLCGRKGSGKTSLIKYNRIHLERNEKCLCLYIALDVKGFPEGNTAQYMTTAIINELDDLTIMVAKENNKDPEQVVLARFEKLWLTNAALPEKNGDNKQSLREKLLLQLHTSKYHEDFENYVVWSVAYIEKVTNKRFIIIFDDIDHLSSDEEALEICNCANGLYRRLQRSMVISVREETLPKLQDKTLPAAAFPKKHIIPPSFKKVLDVRLESLKEEIQSKYTNGYRRFTCHGICVFLDHIIRSICRPSTYAKLVTFHYDIDLLLDIVRCLICSPYMIPASVLKKAEHNKWIGWNLMLNSLQKYVYENHYDENSFFLNMFDNTMVTITELDNLGSVATYEDTFVRIALLRVLAYRLTEVCTLPPDKRIIEVALVKEDMTSGLGYNENNILLALKAFARHRLIRTGQRQNEFDPDYTRDISISTAVLYYLDYLISEYRYVENVLPVTPIDFKFNPQILPSEPETEDLEPIDDLILKFADFIERCEKSEQNRVKDKEFYDFLMEGEVPLSQRLRNSVREMKAGVYAR